VVVVEVVERPQQTRVSLELLIVAVVEAAEQIQLPHQCHLDLEVQVVPVSSSSAT
jgi:hypothetical protein